VNGSTITALTPSRGAGAVDLDVRNPGAQSVTLGHGFSFVSAEAPLTVQSVSPNHGSTVGGEVVTVSGTGFQAGAAVLFGGTAGTTVSVVNATMLTVTTPARCAGPVSVTVSSGSAAASLLDGFRYSGAPMRIDAVSPATGRAGDIVSIRGFGLDPVTGVTFNGVESTAVTAQGNGTIVKCVVPQASGLAIPVSVTVAGVGTAIGTFSYTEAPSAPFLVTSVAPSAGPFGGGNTVTLTGTGFQSGANVTFGASQASNVIVLDSTKITATVPSFAQASEPAPTTVTVVNPGSKAAGSAGAYTYSPTGGGCVTAGLTQCVGGNRLALQVTWKNPYDGGTVGVGAPVPMTSDTGSYWFFDDQNTELVVKVLDGRAANGSFWVFYGALSDVEYDLTVTDTVTGAVKSYRNAPRNLGSVADTKAFPVGNVYQPCENP